MGLQDMKVATSSPIAWLFYPLVTSGDTSNRRPRLPSVKLGKVVRFESGAVERFLGECAR